MVAGIELKNGEYAQISLQRASGEEPVGICKKENSCLFPMNLVWADKDSWYLFFRELFENIENKEALTKIVVCLWNHGEEMRKRVLECMEYLNIPEKKIYFAEPAECFSSYVMNQPKELSIHQVVLISNENGRKEVQILRKTSSKRPLVTKVERLGEVSVDEIFEKRKISAVFLVGEEFEEDWIQKQMPYFKKARKVFYGNNLYVKGACYGAMELSKDHVDYFYLGEHKNFYQVQIQTEKNGKAEFTTILEAGRNWYESQEYLEVLLLEEPKLEFLVTSLVSKESRKYLMELQGLPKRPKKTTRLGIQIFLEERSKLHFVIQDLGFGELFPKSDLVYEKDLELWEV